MYRKTSILLSAVIFIFLFNNGFTRAEQVSQQGISNNAETIRALHIVLRKVSLNNARWIVSLAEKHRFNTIIVQITDGIQLNNSPWKPLPDAWSKHEFISWVKFIQEKNIKVVPEIKLLTHQEKLFQNKYPQLMFNSVTYNPYINEVSKKIHPLLDEIIQLTKSRAIHIGHDEVAGHNIHSRKKWLKVNEPMLPATYFLESILSIHKYLEKKDIETWIWGDMLIAPKEFPTMLARNIFGSTEGYGKTLRNKLPKNIVICDWHYLDDQPDFPSLSKMQNEGFRVIGSTWQKKKTINNFSKYAAQHNAYGMMATTWHHVQRKRWNTVKQIIETSGKTFNKYFPDAK